jgi:ribosome-binding factor A
MALQRELSALLHGNFRSECVLLTITRVQMGDDRGHALVFFATPDEESATACLNFLNSKKNELKCLLAKKISIRRFPELHFHFDRGQKKELRVYEILDGLPN